MKKLLFLNGAALALAGCVTINIYFPAAAAEKAADRIIDEIMQQRQGAEKPAVAPAPQGEKK
jgi:hypothetical protein